jgi:hypothetical protein
MKLGLYIIAFVRLPAAELSRMLEATGVYLLKAEIDECCNFIKWEALEPI